MVGGGPLSSFLLPLMTFVWLFQLTASNELVTVTEESSSCAGCIVLCIYLFMFCKGSKAGDNYPYVYKYGQVAGLAAD